MSTTVTASTSSAEPATGGVSIWFSRIAGAVHSAASKALDFLKEIDEEWESIKSNPAYGTLVDLAVKAATNELTSLGVPLGPMVNIGAAMTSMLDALAAAHPSISMSTPAAEPLQPAAS